MSRNEKLKKAISEVKLIYGLKQSEIAAELGVTGSYLSDMINGRVPLTNKMIAKLSELFHINAAWLRTGSGDIISNDSAVAMEPVSTYGKGAIQEPAGLKMDVKGYERIIRALECAIAAKDETIASQKYAIEVLKEEVEALRKIAEHLPKNIENAS